MTLTCTATACGDIGDTLAPVIPNARMTILAGGGQTVALGDSLSAPVTVRLEIDGAPAAAREVRFMVIADGSPGPNHTWYRTTDANGMASGNGVITFTGRRSASIVVVYEVCMDSFPIKGCTTYKAAASAETRITVN